MSLSQAAAITHGELRGSDCRFDGVAIDSRQINRGDLFIAIRGAQQDGHDFIADAHECGAVGALVSSRVSSQHDTDKICIARINVQDTTTAIGQLGAAWRTRFDYPLVAVTGSNGKTTVTALIAAILNHNGGNHNGGNHNGNCLAPHASFNNHWGVPLTLLRMREQHTHAVIEMGMNARGEIDYLSGLAKPDIALINNVATAHLVGLGDLKHIAAAKAEIFSGLNRNGVAILNADDDFHAYWRERAGVDNILSFGLTRADITASNISTGVDGSTFTLNIEREKIPIALPLLGHHNIRNALAASATAHAAGANSDAIKSGLESFAPISGRLRKLHGINGALILDDTYNANPTSTNAALDVLAGFDGERIAVLGAMAELGEHSDRLHHQVGTHAQSCGIQQLHCLGADNHASITHYIHGFGAHAQHHADIETLLKQLSPQLTSGVTVLVKGSRSAGMERVVSQLVTKGGATC